MAEAVRSAETPPFLANLSLQERAAIGGIRLALRVCGWVAPDAGGALLFRVFTTPRRYPVPAFEQELRASAERLTLRCGGEDLRVWAWGRGPAVLLVHGWEGRGTHLGRFVGPLLDAGFRVLALDGPAHGESGGKTAHMAKMTRAVLDAAAQLGPVAGIIGHSFGAGATVFAVQRGLCVKRIVTLGMPDAIASVVERFRVAFEVPRPVLDRFRVRLESALGGPLESFDVTRFAAELPVQALLIHDRDDTEVPFAEGARVAQAWPAARSLATDGLGHRRILKAQPVIVAAVRFLAEP